MNATVLSLQQNGGGKHAPSNGAVCQPAAFAVVLYGEDKKTLVNTNCAIVHLLLHLRAKCIGDGFDIGNHVRVEGSQLNSKRPKHDNVTFETDDEDDIEYLDLLDKEAKPLLLSSRDPLSLAKTYVKHRAEYVLCSVKKTRDGMITDANPLLIGPSMDLRRRIHSVLRTMEKFQARGSRKASSTKEGKRKPYGNKKGKNDK